MTEFFYFINFILIFLYNNIYIIMPKAYYIYIYKYACGGFFFSTKNFCRIFGRCAVRKVCLRQVGSHCICMVTSTWGGR